MPERAGQGLILCADRKPVRCTYVWGTRERDEGPAIVGTLRATAAALRAVWLAPTVSLRLSTGDRLTISVTDLSGGEARFESVPGPETRQRRAHGRETPRPAARRPAPSRSGLSAIPSIHRGAGPRADLCCSEAIAVTSVQA